MYFIIQKTNLYIYKWIWKIFKIANSKKVVKQKAQVSFTHIYIYRDGDNYY